MKSTPIGFWVKTAFLFLFRSGRSTIVLSLMVVTAVCTLIFLSSLAVGVNDAMILNSVSLYSGHITGFALPPWLKTDNLFVEGVVSVLKRISIPGILSYQGNIETVTLIGVNPSAELKSTAIWKKIIDGKYLQAAEQSIILSQPLAEKLMVKPGGILNFSSGFEKNNIQLKVSGIYRTGIDQLDRGIAFCPLVAIADMQVMWSAAIFLNAGVEPESVIAEFHRKISDTHQFKSWQKQMPDLRQLIDLEYLSMGIVTVLVFGVVSLGIACAFVIFILKNLREYGIMKAMGVTSREITLLIFMEVVLMNLAATFIGIIGGILVVLLVDKIGGIDLTAFTSHNRYFAISGIISPRLTSYSLGLPPLVSFLFGLSSAIWPSVLVVRKRAADILRIV
jgi:ABC-type lipoprotein release transport system permease subunit